MATPITFTTLSGHKDQVLCVDGSREDGPPLWVSSSEDATCRLWDARVNKCTKVFAGVFDGEPVQSVAFGGSDGGHIYAASGNDVFCFDLRQDAVVVKTPLFHSSVNKDEVNEIAVSPDGKTIACCDDTGACVVLDGKTGSLVKTLGRQHDNICSSVQFHPKAKSVLLTGGLDARLVAWDYSRGKPLQVNNMSEVVAEQATENSAQVLNPPFVHCLGFAPSGDVYAAGLGDGNVAFFHASTNETVATVEAHGTLVCQVAFDNQMESQGGSQKQLMYTAACDETLAVWSLNTTKTPGKAKGGSGKRNRNKREPPSIAAECELKFKTRLQGKPNWIAAAHHKPGTVAVADTSNVVTVFSGLHV